MSFLQKTDGRAHDIRGWSSNSAPPGRGASVPIPALAIAWTSIYHSDSLYSAVTGAMRAAGPSGRVARRHGAQSARRRGALQLLLPVSGRDRLRHPAAQRLAAFAAVLAKVRWKGARFVPLGLVDALLSGQALDEDHWIVDGASECLVPAGRPGPFRIGDALGSAAVDRLTGDVRAACDGVHRIPAGRGAVGRRLVRR